MQSKHDRCRISRLMHLGGVRLIRRMRLTYHANGRRRRSHQVAQPPGSAMHTRNPSYQRFSVQSPSSDYLAFRGSRVCSRRQLLSQAQIGKIPLLIKTPVTTSWILPYRWTTTLPISQIGFSARASALSACLLSCTPSTDARSSSRNHLSPSHSRKSYLYSASLTAQSFANRESCAVRRNEVECLGCR